MAKIDGISFAKAKENGWNIKGAEDLIADIRKNITEDFWPEPGKVFAAFERVRPEEVKYVVMGQDPYFQVLSKGTEKYPLATGLAFGVPSDCPPDQYPKSLRRILQHSRCADATLESWAGSGILLLNAALTVPRSHAPSRNQAGEHLRKRYWSEFTKRVIDFLVQKDRPVVTFVCWGVEAKKCVEKVGFNNAKIVWTYHPTASKSASDDRSFSKFWETKPGKSHWLFSG